MPSANATRSISAPKCLRPAVVATAMGYDRTSLEPFVASCRQNVPEATIVLFACGLSAETLSWLATQDVEVVTENFNPPAQSAGWRLVADQCWLSVTFRITRFLLRLGQNGEARSRRAAEALFSVVNQRFYRYRRFLQDARDRFTHVLLVDARDVIFQANPFPCDGLHAFAEDETIGQSHFARRWFLLSYGPRSWRPLRQHPLLNVGTTLGDIESMLDYLEQMCREFDRRLAFFWGADTAMHNYLIHRRIVAATSHPFGEGAAINLNSINLSRLRVDGGKLLNSAGRPYPVVHQYDRVAGLRLTTATLPSAKT